GGSPVDAFATHLDERGGLAVHPTGHEMAAYTGQGLRSLGNLCRRVVRTTRAEIGCAGRAGNIDDAPTLGTQACGPRLKVKTRKYWVESSCDDRCQQARR